MSPSTNVTLVLLDENSKFLLKFSLPGLGSAAVGLMCLSCSADKKCVLIQGGSDKITRY
jgi:hypothetical protein